MKFSHRREKESSPRWIHIAEGIHADGKVKQRYASREQLAGGEADRKIKENAGEEYPATGGGRGVGTAAAMDSRNIHFNG